MIRKISPRNDDERKLVAAVDRFATHMKVKLLRKARVGYDGWDTVAPTRIAQLFQDHLTKGDPVDLANFLMMLHRRGKGFALRVGFDVPNAKRGKFDLR